MVRRCCLGGCGAIGTAVPGSAGISACPAVTAIGSRGISGRARTTITATATGTGTGTTVPPTSRASTARRQLVPHRHLPSPEAGADLHV